MFIHCEAPGCMNEAKSAAKFLDPRRGHGEARAYTRKHFCCDECQLEIVDELERQANYARLVH